MAKLSARGRTVTKRYSWCGVHYCFMSDGKVLRGGQGRYQVFTFSTRIPDAAILERALINGNAQRIV